VLIDMNLPDGNGIDWIPELREQNPDLAIIVVTGHGDIPAAVEADAEGGGPLPDQAGEHVRGRRLPGKSLELEKMRRKIRNPAEDGEKG